MVIFWDVDAQYDFMDRSGALHVPCAEVIKPNLKILTNYAKRNLIFVGGSVDRHFGTEEYKDAEGELQRWGGPFPDHCMNGTKGAEKIWETRFDSEVYIPTRPNIENSGQYDDAELVAMTHGKRSVIFEKQNYDVFASNPHAARLLALFNLKEAVVYGVATDYCVKAAVLGMQARGIQTYVVEDAIKGVAAETTQGALEEMIEAGAKFVTTEEVIAGRIK